MSGQTDLELGLIGNGTVAALIDGEGRYAWLCLPRFDGEPVFDRLLGGEGSFQVAPASGIKSATQAYERNTAILTTVIEAGDGAKYEMVDFAPRFQARGRSFRPAAFIRQIRPLSGTPRVQVELNARAGWGETSARIIRGVNHIRYQNEDASFRLTTNAPVSYVVGSTPFLLDRPVTFLFGPDEPLTEAVDLLAHDWRERTTDNWLNWSRRLAIPFEWQEAVIRAAITLKMCVAEETGGIVAALTTSIPEHAGSNRNWDYRFCWLRDAYFTVTALNRLAAVGTLERYLAYLLNVAAQTDGGHIQPVYGIGLESDLTERIADHLPGYRGHGPVRIGNQAAEHIQHDVYGHVVLGAAQAFFDERLLMQAGREAFLSLEKVGARAVAMHDQPDAGIWEFRGHADVHTSSALMCWAACDRLAKVARRLGFDDRAEHWLAQAEQIRATILERAWSAKKGAFSGAFGGDDLDASVLLMAEVGFLPPSDPRFVATVEQIDKELRVGDDVFRYRTEDDFGAPANAFTACTFWHIDALAQVGRKDDARRMFETLLTRRTRLGLLSEDIDPKTGELWGNFPQTYSMVGIINAAARLSRPWTEAV
jgi:GH15 family glucan-1,4-alpha-glucosidase